MKKITLYCLTMLCALILTGSPAFAAKEDTVLLRKVNRLERYVYGTKQEGGVAERLTKLHKDLLGRDSAKNNPEKADSLYVFLFKGSDATPSLDMKLNYLEWKVFHENRRGKLGERLDALDKLVFGKPSQDALAFRMEQLIQMSIETGIIALHKVKLAKGTQLRVRLDQAISSKTASSGDDFQVSLTSDLVLEKNVLVAPKGGYSAGEVDRVRRAGRFGRSGHLRMTVNEVAAIDGTVIPVVLEGLAETFDKKKVGLAIGAATVGYIALGGPVGLVGGIFVKGREAELPVGTELIVKVLEDCHVNGVVISPK
jgi:hypothetical protein